MHHHCWVRCNIRSCSALTRINGMKLEPLWKPQVHHQYYWNFPPFWIYRPQISFASPYDYGCWALVRLFVWSGPSLTILQFTCVAELLMHQQWCSRPVQDYPDSTLVVTITIIVVDNVLRLMLNSTLWLVAHLKSPQPSLNQPENISECAEVVIGGGGDFWVHQEYTSPNYD